MATGSISIPIKSKKFTGTTTATGTLVIDTTGIYKVIAARARTPNGSATEWRFTCWIRGDEYIQIVDSTAHDNDYYVQANTYVEVEVFYI